VTDSTPKTFVGMPGYGLQSADSGRGLWRARRDMRNVVVEYRQGSLLAANFNGLWCSALNLCHRGQNVQYFAMLHDDVGPQDGWLDTLIEEMEANNLDVLGVVVPIKDLKGVTSTAIDGETTWRPKCRLTIKEVMSLPETFTSKDIGGPLLNNTGCWVCKFDPEWARKVHFTINDRIVFNRATDRYEAEVEPEDWYFSRLCHELNLKIGATRKIQVTHRGSMEFVNYRAWGDQYDKALVSESQLPFKFPMDINGWLFPEEGRALAELAEGKDVLEIGSYCGLSTVCIGRTAKSVTAVDYFDGRSTPIPDNTLPAFQASCERYGIWNKVTVRHPDDSLSGAEFDLVFIDGDHAAESVKSDIDKALSVLRPGGLIAFHDYRLHPKEVDQSDTFDEGVTESVNELISLGGEMVARHKTLAIVRPPQLVSNPE